MGNRKIKRVIITGAGFSAPAKLPIQNRIIGKMTEEPEYDFLTGKMPHESLKFIYAFITVGMFLLNNYGRKNYASLSKEFSELRREQQVVDNLQIIKKRFAENEPESIAINNTMHLLLSSEDVYSSLYSLREKIRKAIVDEQISVNLEDIFTAFDKSIIAHEYLHQYTYSEMDEIRYSITRLFIYYFSKGVQDHSYMHEDYQKFIQYIKGRRAIIPPTIITTNWDTLTEAYFTLSGISFCYGFTAPYTFTKNIEVPSDKSVLLLKVHGSANWLRCLHCGSISVYPDNEAGKYLFEDNQMETCPVCKYEETSLYPSLQPEIITPTMLKSLNNRLYANLWGTAGNELREATEIIFVGYSLPIADFEFRYLLQKNISPDTKIDVVLTQNSNPRQTDKGNLQSLLPEKRYRDAFPKNEISFFYDGFGSYFS